MSPATISSLLPSVRVDLARTKLFNTFRMQGSWVTQRRRVGRSPEFSRPYVSGDPVHLIDWKAFGRSDHLIVREQRDDASVPVAILLDLGASMFWPPPGLRQELPESSHTTKAELAFRVAMQLAYTHLKLGDQLQMLVAFDAGQLKQLNLRTAAEVLRCFADMEAAGFGREAMAAYAESHGTAQRRRQIAYVLSDGLSGDGTDFWPPSFADYLQQKLTGAFHYMHFLSVLEQRSNWMSNELAYFEGESEHQGRYLMLNETYDEAIWRWRERLMQGLSRMARTGLNEVCYSLFDEKTTLAHYFFELEAFASGILQPLGEGRAE